MLTVQSKKNKLNLQIRGLGQASQPAVESDLAAISETDLNKILGGEGGSEMALGRTRSCGGGGGGEEF